VKVHLTRTKGKDNYKVKIMLEGVELKNKGKKPNRIAKWKQGKPHDTKSKNGITMEE